MNCRSAAAALAAACLVSSLAGCASFRAVEPLPAEVKRPVGVAVSTEPPSKMTDMPIGVYQVADSTLYISGHQQGQAAGLLFGLLGLAVAHGVNQDEARQRVKEAEARLHTQLIDGTRKLVEEKLQRNPASGAVAGERSGGGTLELTPFVVLTYVNDTEARPFVIVKARLLDASKQETWWTRYVVSGGEDRPIDGAGGWAADQGQPLREAVRRGLDTALDMMLMDTAGTLPRGKGRPAKLKGRYAFVQQELDLPGEVLEETPQRIVFAPRVGDVVVFAGVNVFDRRTVELGAPDKKSE
jgi:hypothetical protein